MYSRRRPDPALVLGFHVGFRKFPVAEAAEAAPFQPNAFLSIDETGLVTIVASRSEMGTGIKTDLPLVLADELDADWNRVKVVQGQGDPKYGDQNTDGSRSTWQFFGPMRMAGATARQMLETAAAQTWSVPVRRMPGAKRFRRARFQRPQAFLWRAVQVGRDNAGAAIRPGAGKDRKDWRYIGKPVRSSISRTSSGAGDLWHRHRRFRDEIRLDRTLPSLWRQSQILRRQRMRCRSRRRAVVEIPATPMPSGFKALGGIAVIANNTWSAQQGRQRSRSSWDFGPNAGSR